MTYVCFLRGVNVNGRKVLMKDLTSIFASIGFTNIKTVLASGNVIFDLSDNVATEDIKSMCEQALFDFYQEDVYCTVYSLEEVLLMREHNIEVKEQEQLYCLLIDKKATFDEVKRMFNDSKASEGERLEEHNHCLLWRVKKGMTLKSEFGKVLGKKKFRRSLTSRNMNTIKKVVDKANKAL